jgi:hypothetical protein
MRPVDRAAGNRRRLLQAAALLLAVLGAGCLETAPPRRGAQPLEPVYSIGGARLITRMDAAGNAGLDSLGPYVALIHPVAAAAAFNDVYIADAGAARLYRYDRALDALAVLPEPRITSATRLQAGPDGSVYVLDPFASEIRRYSRAGKALPSLRGRQLTSRYADFALDPVTAKAYVLDSAHLAIDEIEPLGQFGIEWLRLDEAGPFATDGRRMFVASARCSCVVEWSGGRPVRRLGAGQLHQPLSLALVGPQLVGLDGFERRLVLVHEEGADTFLPARLGLMQPESLTAAGSLLLVADGAGHRIVAFRVTGARAR